MDSRSRDRRRTAIGFVVALGILGVLVYVVGIGDVVAAMAAADVAVLVVVVVTVAAWIGAWSGTLYLTARAFGVHPSPADALLVYTHMLFLDDVVPFSSVVADPIAAVSVSRALETDYETSLGLVMTVDFVNFLPSLAFGSVGLGALLVTAPLDGTVRTLSLTLVGVLVVLSTAGYLAWRFRGGLARTVSAATGTVLGRIGGIVPGIGTPTPGEVEARIDDLVENVEAVGGDRHSLLVVLGLATAGWTLLATTFWLSLYAVGYAIPGPVAVFLVALVPVAELIPLPGGVGTSESLLVVLLVASTGVPPGGATAGILVHRGATYWLPVVLGGGVSPLVLEQLN